MMAGGGAAWGGAGGDAGVGVVGLVFFMLYAPCVVFGGHRWNDKNRKRYVRQTGGIIFYAGL